MENDSVRTTGESTQVDLWIEGRSRAITVSRRAIEGYLALSSDQAATSETERSEFVRRHLALVVKAAATQLRVDPEAETILIEYFGTMAAPAIGDRRRSGDRRKGDRRKVNLGPPSGIERRR